MKTIFMPLFFALFLFASATARGAMPVQTSPEDLTLVAVGTVAEIIKPNIVRFSDEKIYRIDNIRVPVELTDIVMGYLEKTLLNKKVGIYISGTDVKKRTDRYGHIMAHLMREDGIWVQADMVVQGLAWADSAPYSRDLVRPLYAHEAQARKDNLGLWRMDAYAVRDNDTIIGKSASFEVYEGTVLNVNTIGQFVYLNFDRDFAKDFTLILPMESGTLFTRILPDVTEELILVPSFFKGRKIRVHGWVEEKNGPMMELTHPEMIEFIDGGDMFIP